MPSYNLALRNARMQDINTASSGGTLTLYGGTKPAPGGDPTTALAVFNLKTPAGTVANATLDFTNPGDAIVNADGQVTWARIAKDGAWVADFTVSDAGGTGEIQMSSTKVSVGIDLSITGFKIVEGDA